LEAYLHGQTTHLLLAGNSNRAGRDAATANAAAASENQHDHGEVSDVIAAPSAVAAAATARPAAANPPGQGPDDATMQALRAAGLSEAEVNRQLSAMRVVEQQAAAIRAPEAAAALNVPEDHSSSSRSKNEALDRENHTVVEILTYDEFVALEKCWPGTTLFCLRFEVRHPSSSGKDGNARSCIHFSAPPCRDCDATGRRDSCSLSIKNRSRAWVKKSSEKARAPASLEY